MGEAEQHGACLNCGAVLHGRYCSNCGQSTDEHHRSILRLMWEAVEGATHLDGRLGSTLPLLLFRPGRLARDYLEGRRARHVPPSRLFLISLLLFMLVLETAMGGAGGSGAQPMTITVARGEKVRVVAATPSQMAAIMAGEKTPEQIAATYGGTPFPHSRAASRPKPRSALQRWIGERARLALANPEYFRMVVFTWAHRLAVLLLPIFAAQLALLYVWRRRFWMYDHLVVSMQYLAFVFLVSAVAWLPPEPVRGYLITAAFIWAPINLFLLLRGAYASGWFGALARTVWLTLSTQLVFAVMVVGLIALSLQQL